MWSDMDAGARVYLILVVVLLGLLWVCAITAMRCLGAADRAESRQRQAVHDNEGARRDADHWAVRARRAEAELALVDETTSPEVTT